MSDVVNNINIDEVLVSINNKLDLLLEGQISLANSILELSGNLINLNKKVDELKGYIGVRAEDEDNLSIENECCPCDICNAIDEVLSNVSGDKYLEDVFKKFDREIDAFSDEDMDIDEFDDLERLELEDIDMDNNIN